MCKQPAMRVPFKGIFASNEKLIVSKRCVKLENLTFSASICECFVLFNEH